MSLLVSAQRESSPAPASAPEGRRARRRRELRERVMEAAGELFRKQGFDATTVDEIAAAADIAPATFFNHFHSKNGLVGAMTSDVFEHIAALAAQHFRAGRSVEAQLLGLAEAAGELIGEHHHVARLVMLQVMRAQSRPEDAAPYLSRLREPVVSLLTDGQQRGEVRDDEEPGFLCEMVLGALQATVTHWLADPEYPIAEKLPRAARFVYRAVRAADAPGARASDR